MEEWIARETSRDSWLTEHPPVIEWWPNGVMPFEIPQSEPIVDSLLEATRLSEVSGEEHRRAEILADVAQALHGTPDVAGRCVSFTGQNANVFESAQRADCQLGEDVDAIEDRHRGRGDL